MTRAYLGLGANLGDRLANLTDALKGLEALPATRLAGVSGIYETRPVGGPAQGDYLNAAAALETDLPPGELLAGAQELERRLGRTRGAGYMRWGPRPIDIDILFYGELVLNAADLTLPHPRLAERGFVLAPLAEIAGELRHPVLDKTVAELLRGMDLNHEGIRRLPL